MHKHLSIALLVLLLPRAALAASLTVRDTIAGLGTTAEIQGWKNNQRAAITVTPPYGPAWNVALDDRGTARIGGEDLHTAGTYTVEGSPANGEHGVSTTFTVLPDSFNPRSSAIESDTDVVDTDGSTATIRVIARDRYGNALSGRRFAVISGRTSDHIEQSTGETDQRGEQLFTLSTSAPGPMDLRAMDLISGKLVDGSLAINAESWAVGGNDWGAGSKLLASLYAPRAATNSYATSALSGRRFFGQVGSSFDVVHRFEIRPDRNAKEVALFEPLSFDIAAMDRNGNVVEDYTGTVQIYTTDPEALVPSEVRFAPGDFGVKRLSLSLRFQTPGEPNAIGELTHVIRVEESGSCSTPGSPNCVFGEYELIVRGVDGNGDPARSISVSSPQQDGNVGGTNITVEGKGPPFINIVVAGGVRDVQGETDQDGRFAIAVNLDERQMDHTLRVRDASGRYDSGNIRVHLDALPPTFGDITFDPVTPEVGSPASVRVVSEPGLGSASIDVNGTETVLQESRSASGTYSGIFTPTTPGPTTAIVKLTDAAGNTNETRMQISISAQSLPTVTGVRALGKIEQIELTWNPVEDPSVEGYRIYVGTEPKNYSNYLDSPDPRAGATVGGLKPGMTYYFAVTALGADRESKNKSMETTGVPLGLKLTVTPQDGSLLIEWASLGEDAPLSSFILEYGVDPGDFSEKRMLSGDLRAYTLRDLLNNVTYYLRLTPVTTTGDTLKDLAAEGQGTPAATGRGFRPTAADPVPVGFTVNGPGGSMKPSVPQVPSIPRTGTVHSGAPKTPDVGFPPIAWWIAGAGAVIAFSIHLQRRKTMRLTMAFLQKMEAQYRN